MQAGEEMLRTKVKADGSYDENSYASSDAVNNLKWNDLNNKEYKKVFEYYKGLIAFRKAHAALRLTNAEDVKNNIETVSGLDTNVVAFKINGGVNGETADALFVIFNANKEKTTVELPEGNWNVYVSGEKAGTEVLKTIKNGTVTVDGISAMILAQDDNVAKASPVLPAALAAGAAVIAAGIAVLFKKRKK